MKYKIRYVTYWRTWPGLEHIIWKNTGRYNRVVFDQFSMFILWKTLLIVSRPFQGEDAFSIPLPSFHVLQSARFSCKGVAMKFEKVYYTLIFQISSILQTGWSPIISYNSLCSLHYNIPHSYICRFQQTSVLANEGAQETSVEWHSLLLALSLRLQGFRHEQIWRHAISMT